MSNFFKNYVESFKMSGLLSYIIIHPTYPKKKKKKNYNKKKKKNKNKKKKILKRNKSKNKTKNEKKTNKQQQTYIKIKKIPPLKEYYADSPKNKGDDYSLNNA